MTEAERAQWMTIFEAAVASPGDEMNDDWEHILDQLGLPPEYFLAVLEALRQGRWRNAKNPVSYVRQVARIEARKLGRQDQGTDILKLIDARPGRAFSMEEEIHRLIAPSEGPGAIRGEDGIWRAGWGTKEEFDYDYIDDDSAKGRDRISWQDLEQQGLTELIQPSAEEVAFVEQINRSTDEFHIHLEPEVCLKWENLAKLAGFSNWDRLTLQYRLKGVSRDRALAEQPDEASRKALQAAWRKFDRRGIERLQEAIKTNRSGSVPEVAISDTR